MHWPWCPPPQREVQHSCVYLQGCSMLFNCSISFFHWQVLWEEVWEKAKTARRWDALMRKELHLWNFLRLLENTSFYWKTHLWTGEVESWVWCHCCCWWWLVGVVGRHRRERCTECLRAHLKVGQVFLILAASAFSEERYKTVTGQHPFESY